MSDVIVAKATSGTVYLSNGTSLVASGSFSNVNLGQGTNFVADWNGDGRADVLSLGTQGGTLYLSTFSDSQYTLGAGIAIDSSSGANVSGSYRWVADWNGDGLADLLAANATSGYINYGTGSGLQAGSQITGLNLSQGKTWVGDFNGDGLSDLYVVGSSTGTMYLGTGSSFPCVFASSACVQIAQSITPTSSYVGDFNGDGLTDVFSAAGTASQFNWAALGGTVPTSNQAGDMLVSVTDGYGGRTTIAWKPITDSTVYGDRAAAQGGQQAATGGVLNTYNPVPLFPRCWAPIRSST
ncbi:MAG TPA: VCBS repeat-containing protein [Kofleriaceae bacterium]|jgi:hypothetical protein|nr:VCBS repeat-containing protein [Kofleriaceae bacterium]